MVRTEEKKKIVKRGRGGNKTRAKEIHDFMTVVGNNSAGLNGKADSLTKLIDELTPAVIMLQETKLYKQGKIKLKGYVIFERLRNYGGGGGLMTAVHDNLNPILIENDDKAITILVVDIKHRNNIIIRTMNCYGPPGVSKKDKHLRR